MQSRSVILAFLLLTLVACKHESHEEADGVMPEHNNANAAKIINFGELSYSIDVIGNTIIAESQDLARYVGSDSEQWIEGLSDDRLLDSLDDEVKSEAVGMVQTGEKDGFRVCDLVYLCYCNTHRSVETPRWTEFDSLSLRNSRIDDLIVRLKQSVPKNSSSAERGDE